MRRCLSKRVLSEVEAAEGKLRLHKAVSIVNLISVETGIMRRLNNPMALS